MSFASVNLDMKIKTPKLHICKPNREIIYPLNDIFNSRLEVKRGQINSFSFSFNSKVLRNNEFVDSPLLEKVRGNYLVRLVYEGVTSYFVVVRQNKSFTQGEEIVNVECYLQGYELNKKYIRGINETSKPLRYLANLLLEEVAWEVDYIDGDVDLLFRSYEAPSVTVLQGIFELAERFACIPEFDSVNKKINFKKAVNIGMNKGIRLKEGKFLESFNLDISEEDIVTRLVGYGRDGLEIRSLSPSGANFIQDFSWFLYPFEMDASGRVIRSSRYMTDSLAIALTRYNRRVEQAGATFATLQTQRANINARLSVIEQDLSNLNTQYTVNNNVLDVINYNYLDQAPSRQDWQQAIAVKNSLEAQINSKKAEQTSNNNQLEANTNALLALGQDLSAQNNFTRDQLDELTYYIREVEYNNESIIDPEDLLSEMNSVFDDYRQPPVSLTMTIEAFAEYFDTYLINKIGIGDILGLRSNSLGVDVNENVDSIVYDFDELSAAISLTNARSHQEGDNKFAKDFQSAVNSSTTVSLDKYKWQQGENANTLVNQILQNAFDTAKNVLLGGTENTVTITERGLYNRDYNDPNTFMVINNGILAITPDGGNTVTVAISKSGCILDHTYGTIVKKEVNINDIN